MEGVGGICEEDFGSYIDCAILLFCFFLPVAVMYGDWYFNIINTYISTFQFIQEMCSMLKPWLGSFYNQISKKLKTTNFFTSHKLCKGVFSL